MRTFLIVILVVVFSSCVRNKNGQVVQSTVSSNAKVFEVSEVLQANSYSYLKVKENYSERWVAVTKADIKPGDVYYYDSALEMLNFKSEDLDRTFDVVYFINKISKVPFSEQKVDMPAMHKGKIPSGNAEIDLEKKEGEITLKQLFENRDNYASKPFEIRGIVVKVNREVMGKNWVHIQDGTASNNSFDLTVTTQELPAVGDEVTFNGKLTLNKDFGAGYTYEVIMEDAVLLAKKASKVQM